MFIAARDQTLASMEAIFHLQAEYFDSLAESQTILDDKSFLAMEKEINSFTTWLKETNSGIQNEEISWAPAPDNQSIAQLAQKLIRD